MKILLLNGPNLKGLGMREPAIYGSETLAQIVAQAQEFARKQGVQLDAFQSDSEGELVAAIGAARNVYDGIIINPAALTHTSVALRDALVASGVPAIEVHISNTHKREAFRHTSLTVPVCIGQIMGFGGNGYILAIDAMINEIKRAPKVVSK